MKIFSVVIASVLSLSATIASASTILSPTNADVNFFVSQAFGDAGYQLAVFDDNSSASSGAPITGANLVVPLTFNALAPTPNYSAFVNFTSNSAYVGTDTLALSGNNNFILGISTDGGSTWAADTGYYFDQNSQSTYLSFNTPTGATISLLVDTTVACPPPSVPLPAAAWLFGSGLLGLVGVARRRRA